MIVRMLVTAAPLAAAAGPVMAVATCRPFRRLIATVRETYRTRGGRSLVAMAIVLAILGGQFTTGALELRMSGPSPFTTVPVVGGILGRLAPHLSQLTLLLAMAALIWLALLAVGTRRSGFRPSRDHPYRLAVALWCVWLGWTTLNTLVQPGHVAAPEVIGYLTTALALLVCLLCARDVPEELTLRLLAAMIAVAAALTYLSMVLSTAWSFTDAWTGGFSSGRRLAGPFPQPNITGEVLGIAVLLILAQTHLRARVKLALIGLCLPAMLLTHSRGALVLVVVGVAGGLLRRRRLAYAGLVVAALVCTVVVPLALRQVNDGVFDGRVGTWRLAYSIAQSSPLTGSGGFPLPLAVGEYQAMYAHNQFLHTWADGGFVGLLLLVAAITGTLVLVQRTGSFAGTAMFAGMIATFVFENPIRIYTPAFEIGFTLLLVLATMGRRGGDGAPGPAPLPATPIVVDLSAPQRVPVGV